MGREYDEATENAMEYAMNKFHGLGVVVSMEGIRTVVEFMDEYFEEVYEPEEDEGVGFIVYNEEEVIEYIKGTRPDIPLTAITTILDARQEFMDQQTVYGLSDMKGLEVDDDEEED